MRRSEAEAAARVAVVLRADDRYLRFRTVAGVDSEARGVYAHRKFVTPEILR